MPDRYFERLMGRIDKLDNNNIQAYVLRLAKEKGFFETIFDTILEGVIVIDRKLRIRYVNNSAKELLGMPESVENQKIPRFIKDVDWRGILSRKEEEWGRVFRQELEVLYPVHRYLLFYVVPLEPDKGTAAVIIHDVTESREKTLDTIETEKTHLISLLAAGVAHEIGNPLNSIHIHLQLLERHLKENEGNEDTEALELLKVSKQEVERLDMIISQFLQAVRSRKPDLVPLEMEPIIIETINSLRCEIENRNIDVKCEWPDFLPTIHGDRLQLKQAFYNLLKNAIGATGEGGEIFIRCSYDDHYVIFSVADTGSGISSENIGQIFEPYYSTKKGGNGLGLMIVERIARDHGAELSVESEEGEGTVFTVRLPRSSRRVRLLPSPAVETEKSKPENEKDG